MIEYFEKFNKQNFKEIMQNRSNKKHKLLII